MVWRSLLLSIAMLGCSTVERMPRAAADAGLDAADGSNSVGWCKAQELRATRCGTPFDEDEACEKATCFDESFKPDDSAALSGCLVKLACDKTEDDCFAPLLAKYTADPAWKAFHDACVAKDATCGTSFTGDYCGAQMAMFLPKFFDPIRACVDRPCGEVTNCIEAVALQTGCR